MQDLDLKNEEITIMAVDDEEINRLLIKNMLNLENYNVSLLENGENILDIIKEQKPQLVLLDINMPGKNGFDICKEIKGDKETSNIPVIFLSGMSNKKDIIKGLEIGAVDYITKPFNITEVLARVNTHLKLKITTERLIEIEQQRTLHAAIVSQNHLFNQFLTTIIGQAEILKMVLSSDNEFDREQALNSLDRIEKSSWKLSDIVRKLKDVKKVEYTSYINDTQMLDIDVDTEE